jgi:hypothetical protein
MDGVTTTQPKLKIKSRRNSRELKKIVVFFCDWPNVDTNEPILWNCPDGQQPSGKWVYLSVVVSLEGHPLESLISYLL